MWNFYEICDVLLLFIICRGQHTPRRDISLLEVVCPNGTFRADDSCFRFFGEKKTWDQSNKHCHDVMGGHLASVDTAVIFNQLKTISLKHNSEITWIGGRVSHDKEFEWVDGKHCCQNFWVPGQPDNPGSGVCLELWRYKEGQIGFDDTGCGGHFAFICETNECPHIPKCRKYTCSSPGLSVCHECEPGHILVNNGSVCSACPNISDCQTQKCLSPVVSVCDECEHGFIPVKNASVCFDTESQTHVKCYQSCLVVFTDLLTWGDAREVCKARSGHLYVPVNSNEDQFLRNYLEAVISTDRKFWIGGKLLQSLKTMWLSEMPIYGERWGNKPSNSSEDKCIAFNPNDKFKLTASTCNEELFFICQEKTLYDPNLIG